MSNGDSLNATVSDFSDKMDHLYKLSEKPETIKYVKNIKQCSSIQNILEASKVFPQPHILRYYSDDKIIARINCKTKDDFTEWLKEFQNHTKTTFRMQVTRPRRGIRVIYKAQLRCQHDTQPVSHSERIKNNPSPKHTACKVRLKVTVEKPPKLCKEDYLKEFPSLVTLTGKHNHRTETVSALKYRDPDEATKTKFIELFRLHSPSESLQIFKEDLTETYGENYFMKAADRAMCPDLQWVFRLYRKVFNKEFGEGDNLEKNIEEACSKSSVKNRYAFLNDKKDFVIAACSPLMERSHSLEQAGHIVFVDSSGNMDRYNCRMFLLLTDSATGGLPLGVIISSSESSQVLTVGLELLKEILPENAFGNKGCQGPNIFMTDDSAAEQLSLQAAFPNSIIWLCTFHICQAVWRWLWDSHHNINKDDRKTLYYAFKRILDAETEKCLENAVRDFESDKTVLKYKNFQKYVSDLLNRKELWCRCYRKSVSRGNNTNNTVETAFKLVKDNVLKRNRAYNVSQLFSKITIDLPEYYCMKTLDVINGRCQYKLKYMPSKRKLKELKILEKSDSKDLFVVKNVKQGTTYEVNPLLGFCTCYIGKDGAPCKHQHKVILEEKLDSENIMPCTANQKLKYLIATGSEDNLTNNKWYGDLVSHEKKDTGSLPDVELNRPNDTEKDSVHIRSLILDQDNSFEHDSMDYDENSNFQISKLPSEVWEEYYNSTVNDFISNLKVVCLNNPKDFSSAMEKFQTRLNEVKNTESSLLKALHNFGEEWRKTKKATIIHVQSGSIIRRKSKIGTKRRQQPGRTKKSRFTETHGYCSKKTKKFEANRNKRSKAPHSLEEYVGRNISLGKQH